MGTLSEDQAVDIPESIDSGAPAPSPVYSRSAPAWFDNHARR